MPAKQTPLIPFGEWTPDQLDTFSAGATVARNCRTQGDDYIPQPDIGAVSAALGERCMGAFACRDSMGTVHQFAGTASALFKLSGTAWTAVTRSGSGYSTSADGWWCFINFGDRVMATNLADYVQSFILGMDTQFSNLTAAPQCHGLVVINNFVVAFGIVGYNQRTQWCALNNPTDWTPSLATQADYNDILGDGGNLQWVAGSQNTGTAVMEKELWRLTYVGGGLIFQFDRIESQTGTPVPRSVAAYGAMTFYLAENGMKLFDGTQSLPIGDGKVDKYFYSRVDRNYLRSRVMTVADPNGKAIVLGYPNSADSNDGTITHLLVVAMTNRYRWTEVAKNLEVLQSGLTIGLTLDNLTTLYGTLDQVPFSFGSAVWQGGSYLLAGFDTNHKLGFFDGANLQATIETTEAQLNPGGFAAADSVMAITDASDVQIQIGYRNGQSNVVPVTYTAAQTPQADTGECNFEEGAKYHRARITLGGTWKVARGVEIRPISIGGV